MTVRVGLTLSPTEDLRAAALPLFEEELVEALEWPIDMGFPGVPDWCDALLTFYGSEDCLVAHGVELSLLTVGQARRRERWLDDASEAFATYTFAHLSEHLGLMTAGSLVGGTPLPHPFTTSAVELGARRLGELHERFEVPVGLENLALALGPSDVDAQPDFLEALLAPVDGFLLLDLHNLLCHAENFDRDPLALLRRYPLHRVREIHLAGGTHFTPREGSPFRRDDHERNVPDVCLEMLDVALASCPSLEYVFLEYADNALRDADVVEDFRATYRRVHEAVARRPAPVAPPWAPTLEARRDGGEVELERAQTIFLETLDDAEDADAAREALAQHPTWSGWTEGFSMPALELAHHLVERWGERREKPGDGMMRAAKLERVGRVAWRTIPIPEPGPGQLRLRVETCGVCGTDVGLWTGRLRARLPLVLGHEPVGLVDALGEGVTRFSIGDRVGVPWAQAGCGGCELCARGQWRFCRSLVTWMKNGGGDADYVLAEASGVVAVPTGIDASRVSPLLCAGYTVFSALERAAVQEHERVAVLGIGGLGHLALQLAGRSGAEVFALTSNPTKVDDARAFGATEVIASDRSLEMLARAGGADVILATSSDIDLGDAVNALRPEGRLVVAGVGPGTFPVAPHALVEKGASILGALPGPREDLEALLMLAAAGVVKPRIERYPLGQLRRVLHRLEDRRVRYRAVLVP